jgi:hypothetical protein
MAKARSLRRCEPLPPARGPQPAFPSYSAQRQHHPDIGQETELLLEVRATAIQLFRRGTVAGWRAPDGGRDIAIGQAQAIVATPGGRLVGPPETVKCLVKPDATGIPGEYAAGSIAAVRAGGKSNDQQPSSPVTEPGHRTSPIPLRRERRLSHTRDCVTVVSQTGTEPTLDDPMIQRLPGISHDLIGKAEE